MTDKRHKTRGTLADSQDAREFYMLGVGFDTEYWHPQGIRRDWRDCKCKGNGWCEYHDDFNPEDDSHAV